MEKDNNRMTRDNPATKKKPPKLKTIARSISVAIEHYHPTPTMIIDDSLILEDSIPPLPSSSATLLPNPNLYYISGASGVSGISGGSGGSSTSNTNINMMGGGGGGNISPIQQHYDERFYHTKKSQFRRSDTLDIHSPSNLQMRKQNSFHINEQLTPEQQQLILSRRTSSVRGTGTAYLFPPMNKENLKDRSPSPSRRGCRTHRSFNDQTRRPIMKNELTLDNIKHASLNDDIYDEQQHHQHYSRDQLQTLSPINLTSLENQLIRSRSNSHTKIEDMNLNTTNNMILNDDHDLDIIIATSGGGASGSNSSGGGILNINAHRKHSHKHSSNSLDQQQAATTSNFKRGGKYGQSLYLSPNALDELQVHRSLQGSKKSHSASMRVRPYRETLNSTKKSKSFIIDSYPVIDYKLSPNRRDSRILTTSTINPDEIKRSPRPPLASTSSAHLIDEQLHHHQQQQQQQQRSSSFERKASVSTYEMGGDVDFDPMLRPFRQSSRRKSSLTGSVKKLKKQSISDDTDDEDHDSDRKRKRIACIIMTVFLCLVCASVFVVVITLTHSSVAQVQNQTRKVYTFSRDSPIHYNVRQENERLMQESMNRARIAKNYTDNIAAAAASMALTAEEIP